MSRRALMVLLAFACLAIVFLLTPGGEAVSQELRRVIVENFLRCKRSRARSRLTTRSR